jgi:hypothetical protein
MREESMRALVTGVALLLMGIPASDLGAKTTNRQAKRYIHAAPYSIQRHRYGNQDPGWYEHIADKLPFGSSIWWEQMSRERRVNH